jgi:general secretion pathway protein G
MDNTRGRRNAWGFTLFEFVIVISIIAIVAAVLVGKLENTAEQAEKISMQYTVDQISTALLFEFANKMVRNKSGDIPGMMQVNPVDWLVQKPGNYLGELASAPTGDEPLGNWYYDTKDHFLVYLVRRSDNFTPDSTGLKRVRYRVKLLYDDEEPKGMVGMILSPVEPFKWF